MQGGKYALRHSCRCKPPQSHTEHIRRKEWHGTGGRQSGAVRAESRRCKDGYLRVKKHVPVLSGHEPDPSGRHLSGGWKTEGHGVFSWLPRSKKRVCPIVLQLYGWHQSSLPLTAKESAITLALFLYEQVEPKIFARHIPGKAGPADVCFPYDILPGAGNGGR